MKQLMRGLAIGLLALVLVACSDTADVKPGTNAAKKSDLTIEEVFEKAKEASDKVESMKIEMAIQQNMKAETLGIDMDTDIEIAMEIIEEPIALHQVMKVGIGEGDNEKLETELYMAEEGLFMKEPMTDNWISLPPEMFEEVSASIGVGENPSLNLDSLEKLVDDFTFEQNDEDYILNLKASGEQYKELMLEVLESSGITAGLGEDETEFLNNMVIHQLDYELFIDKKTFDTRKFNLSMDMEIGMEGEQTRIVQNLVANISQINDIEKIVVPDEVKDNALKQ